MDRFKAQPIEELLVIEHYEITRAKVADLSLEQVKAVMSTPIERSSISSQEDFGTEGGDRSPTEFFALLAQGIKTGKIKTRPVEEFADEDKRYRTMVEEAGPVRITSTLGR